MALPNMDFWAWLAQPQGLIEGDPNYYSTGAAQPFEYSHALQVAVNNLQTASDPTAASTFWEFLVTIGAIQGDPTYYSEGRASPQEVQHAINVASDFFISSPAGDVSGKVTAGPITDVPPVSVGSTIIPQGARLVRVRDPEGSDAAELFYLVYNWRGVELAYEVGDRARFDELFGSVDVFDTVSSFSQAGFDAQDFTLAGSVDTILGSTESLGSQIEREVRALGLEDLPSWLADSPQALALVAQATAQEWSPGRLWTELSDTQAFQDRFGVAFDLYSQGGVSIQQAVDTIIADELSLSNAIRPFQPSGFELTPQYLQGLLLSGWTPQAAAKVLQQAATFRDDPDIMAQANAILAASGLSTLGEIDFINAMNGFGPAEIVEALNTAAAGRALAEAGLDDIDVDLLTEIVDTSDRLLTADSFRELAQQLAFNFARFGHEFETSKLGISREDAIAAMFGEESPSGKTSGEVFNLLARFERDRRAAGGGFEATTAFQDVRGRLRIQGLGGL